MLKFLKKEWLPILFIIADIIVAIVLYPSLPDRIPTHWGINGQINGWGQKNVAIFGILSLIIGMYALLSVIPTFDPKKHNYEKFGKFYGIIKTGLTIFFSIIFGLSLAAAMKIDIQMDKTMTILLGILWIFMGNYMFSIKQNWFVGIRTPWTIEDEEVWNRTHRLAGKLWVGGGVLILISSFVYPPAGFAIIMITGLIPVVYSYVIYKKKQEGN